MDAIKISNLEIFGHHGVYPEENVLGQKFLIDAVLFLDLRKAGRSDKLTDSVSYGDVIRLFKEVMTKQNDKLLERAAERLAEAALTEFPLIREIELTLKKPWAPVLTHLDYAAVQIRRGWHRVYIGAGSNMGNRETWLDMAADELKKDGWIRDFAAAGYIETEPWGYKDQDSFMNTVFGFETLYTARELLKLLQGIEKKAGRERTIHWGPRTLDLDILVYDQLVTEDEDLVIPHPLMDQRLFVMEPLCELAPYGVHPLTGERYCRIRDCLKKDHTEHE